MNDLKFAFRQLRKSPGFTVAVVVTLGVGIGINVAMYSILQATLLSELPFPEADRLVAISEVWGDGISPTSYPDYLDWKAAQHSFEEIAVSRRDDFNMTSSGEPERFSGLFVTASYFRVLKVPAKLGRTFFDEEDSVAGVNPVVLSEHLWRSRFAADPNIVGRKLILNTISYEVVGVAAESLSIIRNPETARNSEGARNADLYAPFGFYANRPYLHNRSEHPGFYGIARLKQGVSIDQARADLKVIARNLEIKYPDSNTGVGVALNSLRDNVIGNFRSRLWLLEAGVALVLVITCANIAALLLVRTTTREKELAMRAALGASRRRLIRQLLTESFILAFFGGALGCLLAFWTKDLIMFLAPHDFPRMQPIRLDLPVLAFGAVLTLATSWIFGFAPAWKLSKAGLISHVEIDWWFTRRPRSWRNARRASSSCLRFIDGSRASNQNVSGFRRGTPRVQPKPSFVGWNQTPWPEVSRRSSAGEVLPRGTEKIEALPGVTTAAIDDDAPFSGFRAMENFTVTGQPEPPTW